MEVESHGKAAERVVVEKLRAALPATEFHLYPNAEWLGPMREGGPARDGEADLVIVNEENGLLVLEVKSGAPSRDSQGRWWIGGHELSRDPFKQAAESKHQLVRKLQALPDWPPRTEPRAGHAIALPEVDLASLARGHVLLGADAPRELVLDAQALETPESIRRWVEGAYACWLGDGTRGAPLGALGLRLIEELLAPTWSLHRLVRGRIEDDRAELVAAGREQAMILNRTRRLRQVEVVGPAGSGKSMLAAEKARRLAARGLPDAARLLQPAAGDQPHARSRGGSRAGARRARPDRPGRDDLPPTVRTPGHRSRSPAAAPDADPPGLVG